MAKKRRICVACKKKTYMDKLIYVSIPHVKDVWICSKCGIEKLFDGILYYDYTTMNDHKFKPYKGKI